MLLAIKFLQRYSWRWSCETLGSNGNLGIGLDNSVAPLDVKGGARFGNTNALDQYQGITISTAKRISHKLLTLKTARGLRRPFLC